MIDTTFDYSNFPFVRITISEHIRDREDFDFVLEEWLRIYTREQNYYLIFDTTRVKSLPLRYIYDLAKFVKKLKKLEIQYLKSSILIMNSKFTRSLFQLLLKLQKPISEVHIISNDTECNNIIANIKNKTKIENN